MRLKAFIIIILFVIAQTIRDPYWGVIAYTAINIIRPEMLFWGGDIVSRSQIILFGATLAGIVLNFSVIRQANNYSPVISKEIFFMFFIYFAFLLTMPKSLNNLSVQYEFLHEFGKIAFLCLLIYNLIYTPEKLIKYQFIIICAFSLLGVWGIEQHFRGNYRLEGLGGSAWGDSNGVGANFVLFFPVSIGFISHYFEKKIRIISSICAVVMAVLIIYTSSRGAFLGLCVTLLILFIRSKRKILIGFGGLIFFLSLLMIIDKEYIDRLKTITTLENTTNMEYDASAGSRLVFWQAALMILSDNPFLGVGFGAYPTEKLKYSNAPAFRELSENRRVEYFRSRDPYVTHSTYLQMLSEGGLIIGGSFLYLIFGTFYSNWRTRKKIKLSPENAKLFSLLYGIEAGLLGYCICIIFINSMLFIFFPIQLVVCAKIRKQMLMISEADVSNK